MSGVTTNTVLIYQEKSTCDSQACVTFAPALIVLPCWPEIVCGSVQTQEGCNFFFRINLQTNIRSPARKLQKCCHLFIYFHWITEGFEAGEDVGR